MALLYLYWFDRERLKLFLAIIALPLVLYAFLKINAVGLTPHSRNAPISQLNLFERLMTAPSVFMLYITKLALPVGLASGYYWTNPSFSFVYTLLPLFLILMIVGYLVYANEQIQKKTNKSTSHIFKFFAIWTVLGIIPLLQIFPLDLTASETWFYFPMAGILAMIGVLLDTYKDRINKLALLSVAVCLIVALGTLTALRGQDWGDQLVLAKKDAAASKENYRAYDRMSNYYLENHNFAEAEKSARSSISIYPNFSAYTTLGSALLGQGEYLEARQAYIQALSFGDYSNAVEHLALITLVYGDEKENAAFYKMAIQRFPSNATLLRYYAVWKAKTGDREGAKLTIMQAVRHGGVPDQLYNQITNGDKFQFNVNGTPISITVE
jgi:tetratricopeptide (TPR) repeat protein